jgi:hypothetical protein
MEDLDAPPVVVQAEVKKAKKKRWGQETEAGLKVLQAAVKDDETEPASKKRRSRWEPEDGSGQQTAIPGLPGFSLPLALAHLIDINPEAMELQKQLGAVRLCVWCILSTAKLIPLLPARS